MGGTSYSLLLLIKFLKVQNYDFIVLIPEKGEFVNYLENEGIEYIVQPIRRRFIPKLMYFVKKNKIKLIYGNNFSNGSWIMLIVSKFLGIPFVWHIREMISPNVSYAENRLSKANQIIAVSNAVKNNIEKFMNIRGVNVAHNGIDFSEIKSFKNKNDAQNALSTEFGEMKDKINILMLSPIVQRKNQMFSIKCLEKILKTNDKVRLFLVGNVISDEFFNQIKLYIEKNNLEDKVHLLGFRKIHNILLAFDIMLHTALSDPHPRAVLESMAAGIPVVASKVDGIPETIIDGYNGYLYEPNSLDSAVKKLRLMVDDEQLRLRLGKSGSISVKDNFSAKSTADKVHNILKNLVK